MKKSLLVSIGTVAVLTACNNENPAEFMYEHLEESVSIEMEMSRIQEPLQTMEQDELAMYEEMLTISDIEDIVPLSEEAIASAEERRGMMEEELEIVELSYEEFNKARDHLDDLDEEVLPYAEDVMSAMDERYEHYQELHSSYMASIDLDIELYEMMKDEDVEIEMLEEQHDTVNAAYEEISALNDEFNELTRQYNDSKRDFYEAADLNVTFE